MTAPHILEDNYSLLDAGWQSYSQAIFHPFAVAAGNRLGKALKPFIKAPSVESKAYGEVPARLSPRHIMMKIERSA